jgi:hypothetical protein
MEISSSAVYHPMKLSKSLVEWFEHCVEAFGLSLSDVRLCTYWEPSSHDVAFARDLGVYLNAANYVADIECEGRFRNVIAHEVCHLRQFAQGDRSEAFDATAFLEHEANEQAAAVVEGLRPICVGRANRRTRLNWNRFGHYWTVLAAARFAGCTVEDSKHFAFFDSAHPSGVILGLATGVIDQAMRGVSMGAAAGGTSLF